MSFVPPPRLVPYCELPRSSPLGAAPQIVWLAGVAQVFRGLYRGPFDRDVPLPPHYWELTSTKDPTRFIRTTRSSKYGVSFLLKGQKLKSADPADTWILSLRPDIADDDIPVMITAREIWIDLDQNTWVLPPEFPVHEKRKLMRLPLWTSPWKARSGGFADGPSGGFLSTGIVTTAELLSAFGTDKRPWKVVVDHQFFRTYVQFRYHNFDTSGLAFVRPGLGVKALGRRLDQKSLTHFAGTVGGGTAIDVTGTVFLLHERTEEQSGDVELFWEDTAFSLSGPARRVRYVDVKTDVLERKPAAQVPASVKESYVLPGTWHSFGWEARIGFGPRKPWAELRPKPADSTPARSLVTTQDEPLVFHLDDIALADKTGAPLAPSQASGASPAIVSLYDHLLRVRQPDLAGSRPQLWATKIVRPYIPGDDGFAALGDEPEQSTRLVVREHRFFDVRDRRVEPGSGTLGALPCVGARMAVEEDHPWVDYLDGVPWLARQGGAHKYGMCQIHYIDSSYAKDERGGGPQPLAHVVVSVPCLPQPVTQADDAAFYWMLVEVEARWSQGHPGIAPGTKDYAIVPRDISKPQKQIVRFRFVLALVSADEGKALELKRGMPKGAGCLVDHATNTRFVNCADDALLVNAGSDGDADQVMLGNHGMSHEFGHVWGLYDEYPSGAKPAGVSPGLVLTVSRPPRFAQSWHDGRSPVPFMTDWPALMHNNRRPRLRHYWQFVEALNREPAFAEAFPDAPYIVENQHAAYEGHRLRYELPRTGKQLPGSDLVKPWDPIWQGKVGLSDALLYRLGDDEGSVGRMLQRIVPGTGTEQPPLPKNRRCDGLLVLRTYFWFDFQGSFPAQPGDQPLDPQWLIARALHDLVYDENACQRMRVCIAANPAALPGPAPLLSRVAVLIQPQIEFGPDHGRTGIIDVSKPPIANGISPHVWCVVHPATTPLPNPLVLPTATMMPLQLNPTHVKRSLLRLALGIPWAMFVSASGSRWVPHDDPFDPAELNPIAALVGQVLGDAPSSVPSRQVVAL